MRKAAQYLRMSTDIQHHSIDVQVAAIAAYAERNGLEIVQTYLDAGRSGLTIRGRPQLQRLLEDAQAHRAAFDFVLVYDVSRWGRFQEVDEAAKYEQLCRDAGLQVIYCAEPFEGSGQMVTALMKTVRRVMAAEYSRDLSEKVAAALGRIAADGDWTGGRPPYGYERWVRSEDGEWRQLKAGQRKGAGGRTTLRPGPPEKIRAVRRVFQLFVEHCRNRSEIARTMTAEGHPSPEGRSWSHWAVNRILTSETYIGTRVSGTHRQRLGSGLLRQPRAGWTRTPNAFEPLIERKVFAAAEAIIAGRRPDARRWSDEEMIAALVGLKERGGQISVKGITVDRSMPWPRAYLRRFGSMGAAYQLAGLEPHQGQAAADGRAAMRARRAELCNELGLILHSRGVNVCFVRGVLQLDGWFRLIFSVNAPRLKRGRQIWEFRRPAAAHRLLVGTRLESRGGAIIDHTLVDPRRGGCFRLGPQAPLWQLGPRTSEMEGLADLVQARLNRRGVRNLV